MRKIVFCVLGLVLGVLLLIGGGAFAVFMHDYYTPNFDEYEDNYAANYGDSVDYYSAEEKAKFAEEKRIRYPTYAGFVYDASMFAPELLDCYLEIDRPCFIYANTIAKKYENNADLSYTVERVGDIITITFSGVGYPKNGEPEELARTYIFDVEGVGADKLPRLVNRAEFIGY